MKLPASECSLLRVKWYRTMEVATTRPTPYPAMIDFVTNSGILRLSFFKNFPSQILAIIFINDFKKG